MKKLIITMVIFLLLCVFSVSAVGKDHAFILDEVYFPKSKQQFYENRSEYPIEVNNYGQIRVILDIRKSYEISDNEIVKTFDPVPPTSQYFPENAFKISIFKYEKDMKGYLYYEEGYQWEELLGGIYNSFIPETQRSDGSQPLKRVSSNDPLIAVYYDVDFEDMEKTNGRYVIQVVSISDFYTEGIVRIDYPGEKSIFHPETEKYHDKLPDLVINNVRLNDENELTVTVKNIGDRLLHKGYHLLSGERAVTLLAKINGKNYGATLQGFDPEKILAQKPGTEVEYTFENTKINKSSNIEVYIDYNNIVVEENKDNNYQEVKLGGLNPVEPNIKPPTINIQ